MAYFIISAIRSAAILQAKRDGILQSRVQVKGGRAWWDLVTGSTMLAK